MRKRGTGSRVGRPVRHGVASAIFWLLPLLAFAGMLGPGFVEIAYEEEEEEIAQRSGSVPFRPVRLDRPPLIVARNHSAGFIPELLDLEVLFRGSDFRGELGRKLGRLPSFPSHTGDTIVIDDIDSFVADQFFEDLLQPSFVVSSGKIWDPEIFDVIPPLFPIGDDNRFDDFPEPGIDPSHGAVVVPEPGTGLLISLGLAVLGLARRRRS